MPPNSEQFLKIPGGGVNLLLDGPEAFERIRNILDLQPPLGGSDRTQTENFPQVWRFSFFLGAKAARKDVSHRDCAVGRRQSLWAVIFRGREAFLSFPN